MTKPRIEEHTVIIRTDSNTWELICAAAEHKHLPLPDFVEAAVIDYALAAMGGWYAEEVEPE